MEIFRLPRVLFLRESDARRLFWEFLKMYGKNFRQRVFDWDIKELLPDLELFLRRKYDEFIDDADVDGLVIVIGEKSYGIWSSDEFLDILARKIFREGGTKGMLLSGIEVLRKIGIGEKRIGLGIV